MDIFFEIHKDLPREAPGDDESTRRAFSLLADLPARPRVLDIGCGPGGQTLVLAQQQPGSVFAFDTHRPFLRELDRRAADAGLAGRITTLQMSMFDPGFAPGSFDLVWSEGAIYILGFDAGLGAVWRLLKPGGYLAVTELSWLRPNPPEEARAFWRDSYTGMRAVVDNRQAVLAAGYREVGWFILPESSWIDSYYAPMEARITRLRAEHPGDETYRIALDDEAEEIDIYKKYSAWYGYVFYVMQKI